MSEGWGGGVDSAGERLGRGEGEQCSGKGGQSLGVMGDYVSVWPGHGMPRWLGKLHVLGVSEMFPEEMSAGPVG